MMNGTTTSTRSDMHSTAGGGAEAAAEAADLHGSADGLVSDNSLFDLMADDLMDLAAEDDGLLDGTSGSATGNGCSSSGGSKKSTNTKKRNPAKKKAPSASAASSVPTESFEYITTDQINKHDVLCGRGKGIVNNPGNEHFRTLVVARRDEYNAAQKNSIKNEIARSLCQHIRTGVVPPGRFLKRATKAQAAKWGFVGDEAAENVWVSVDEKTMMDRAMQSLREKDVKYVDKMKQGKSSWSGSTVENGSAISNGSASATAAMANAGGWGISSQQYPASHLPESISHGINMLSMAGGAPAASGQSSAQVQQNLPPIRNGFALAQHQQQQQTFHPPPDFGLGATNTAPIGANVFGGLAMGPAVPALEVPLHVQPTMDGTPANSNAISLGQSSTLSQTSISPDTFSLDQTRGAVSLKDWISSEMIRAMSLHGSQVQEADRYYQLEAAKLALRLLQTVRLYHQNGTIFGNGVISSESLGVSQVPGVTAGAETGYCIAFKGTNPESLSPSSSASFDDNVRADLASIGAVLYELFSGIPPFQNQEDADLFHSLAAVVGADTDEEDIGDAPTKKRGRASTAVSTDNNCIPLRDLGLPVAIDDLVKSLMKPQHASNHSKQIDDFITDVQLMVDDPDRYLYDIEGSDATEARCRWGQPGSRLEFSQGKLYGRDEDTALLMSVFERAVRKGGRTEVVTVSGYSGVGKTVLIQQLRQPTVEQGGYFISGKFDTLRQAKPLSAVVQALDAFCDDLASLPGPNMDTIQAIKNAIGDDTDAITRLIPNLRRIVPTKVDDDTSVQKRRSSIELMQTEGGVEIDTKALNRLMYLFRRLFSAIATPSHPVILFIDDLQWADAMSLDLIREIVCASGMRSLMFVGSYRSNEVDQDHPLLPQLSQIQGVGVPLLNIELSSMDKSSINALISDTLKLSPLLTRSLSDAVYSKTSGNCLFVVELLSDLHRQNLLRYSISSRRWEWDDDAVVALRIKSNVVDLMRRKLLRLGSTEMWSVKVVSCLGAETQQLTLELLSQGLGLVAENGLTALLRRPVDEGLLIKVGPTYRFSHDQIQQAAYSLVSIGDRPSFHLKLGRSLLKGATANEGLDNDILFTCVDQLNRGSSEISDHSEKILVAQLNLQAAKNASAASAFLAASFYLRSAKAYLEENDWQTNYDLCLEVYSTLSETEYVTGDYEEMTILLNEIFARARTFDDKLRAYYTLTRAFASKKDLKSAIEVGFEVLGQLGEPIDTNADRATGTREIFRTKNLLTDKDKEWFVNQRMMSDHHKLSAMKYLHLLFLYVYLSKSHLAPMIACKMIDLTVQYGLCAESAYALAAYAAIICGFLEDYTEAYRAGKVAQAIIDKLNAPTLRARVNPVLYGVVNHWIEPLHSSLSPLVEGRDAAIATGDPEYAMVAMQLHNMDSFQCGVSLSTVAHEARTLVEDCKRYQLDMPAILALPLLQCAQNLISTTGQRDPSLLEGDSLQGSLFVTALIEQGNVSTVCQFYVLRVVLAYLFGRDELAAEMYDKCLEHDVDAKLLGRFTLCVCAFYGCLAALSMQRKHPGVGKWQVIIERNISRMKRWSSFSPWNCEHKLLFLQAEQMANAGDHRTAIATYEKAIRLAKEHRFVNEEALIYERYSAFLFEAGDKLSAGVQRSNAYDAYQRWGALQKCEEMKKEKESRSGHSYFS